MSEHREPAFPWRRYLRFWGPNVDADVEDELQYHLDMLATDFERRGLSRDAARAAARAAFGDVDTVRRSLARHDARRLRLERTGLALHGLGQDLGYAWRQLRAAPRFTLSVVAMLALGIGANTAVFSAIDAAFFRPLPFPAADRLAAVRDVDLPFELAVGPPSTTPMLADLQRDTATFSSAAAYAVGALNLGGGAEPLRATIAYVTRDFFGTLGRRALLGRTPATAAFERGATHVAVLSSRIWRRQFGGDPRVMNRDITLNDVHYHVIGVMPADFNFPAATDVWIPLALPFGFDIMEAFHNFLPSEVVVRLAPGSSVERATARMDQLRRRLRTIRPDDTPRNELVRPLRPALLGERRTALLIAMSAAGLLLLIACANVANLLFSRITVRQQELATRFVLGATRGRVVRQLLAETGLLILLGATAAVLVAAVGIRALGALLPPSLEAVSPPTLDGRMLAFTLVIAGVTTFAIGLWPALGASRPDLAQAIKGLASSGAASRRGLGGVRAAFVVGEVSLALVLLVGAGLMGESLRALLAVDSGLRTEHVATARFVLSRTRYASVAAKASFYESVIARLRATPGVSAAAGINTLPLEGAAGVALRVAPEGAYDERHAAYGTYLIATPGYFAAVGARLRGSDLPEKVDSGNPVAIINEALAGALWPGKDAIGRRLRFGEERRTVIGVVSDIRNARLDRPATEQLYLPMSEQPQPYGAIVVRGDADDARLLAMLRDAVASVDRMQPLYALETMDDVVGASVRPRRTNTLLLGAFGLVALLLAAVGVYAVVSYTVERRTREIGIRLALGARQSDVLSAMLRHGAWLTGIGLVVGSLLAFILSRTLSSVLYETGPHDPKVFVAAPAILAVVALVATLLPAMRATRVDAVTALRAD